MYFAGYSPESLRALLNSETEPLSRFVKTILFGPERVVNFLGSHTPIRVDELDNASRAYNQFLNSRLEAAITDHPIAYVIARPHDDSSNINRWYLLDGGTVRGDYILYRTSKRVRVP